MLDALGHAIQLPAKSFELRRLEGLLDNIKFSGAEASIFLGLRIVIGILGVVIAPVDWIAIIVIASIGFITNVLAIGTILSSVVIGSVNISSVVVACLTIVVASIATATTVATAASVPAAASAAREATATATGGSVRG